jgi:hypothetical protein
MSWVLVLFVAVNASVTSVSIPGFRSEASCTAAAALTISELDSPSHVNFVCLKQ